MVFESDSTETESDYSRITSYGIVLVTSYCYSIVLCSLMKEMLNEMFIAQLVISDALSIVRGGPRC